MVPINLPCWGPAGGLSPIELEFLVPASLPWLAPGETVPAFDVRMLAAGPELNVAECTGCQIGLEASSVDSSAGAPSAAPPARTQSSTSAALNFQNRPTL